MYVQVLHLPCNDLALKRVPDYLDADGLERCLRAGLAAVRSEQHVGRHQASSLHKNALHDEHSSEELSIADFSLSLFFGISLHFSLC